MNIRAKSVLFAASVVLLIAIPLHARQGGSKRVWDGVFTSAQAARGKVNYDLSCSRCHNLALIGSERGPAIKGNSFLSRWEKDTLSGLFIKIRDTMPEGGPGNVTDDDKADILSYILQQNGFPAGTVELTKNPALLDEIRMTRKGIWDGIFTTAQADRGKAALLQNGCNGCHGAELEGARGPSLKGERFIGAWEDGSVSRLFTKIRDTMPPLNAEQVAAPTKIDIVAYLLLANGYPAGPAELNLDQEALDNVLITKKGSESAGPPNFTLVRVMGCLTQRPNNRWALINASEPITTREETSAGPIQSTPAGPGTQSFELVSVRPAFKADAHKGHKMEARGLLYRDSNYAELNLTSLEMAGQNCTN
jgi:mono/diheme cytochrome c family protein